MAGGPVPNRRPERDLMRGQLHNGEGRARGSLRTIRGKSSAHSSAMIKGQRCHKAGIMNRETALVTETVPP